MDRVLRGVAIAIVAALGAIGVALPSSLLVGGGAWLAFLFFVLSGWGYLVARVARVPDGDFGLRVVWGIAGYLAVAGLAIAIGVCARPVVLGFIAVGFAGFAWRELVVEHATWRALHAGVRAARERPLLAAAAGAIGVLAIVHLVGAVAQLDRNPWDDDISYTPLVKRLLDTGNLVEPFSFRRLGAYGGQTALDALAAARGAFANVHLIDRGLCLGVALLAIVGYARQLRVPALWLALVTLLVLLAPDTSINTASYWSGVAMFVGLYRTAAHDDRAHFALAGLVGAATCSLRQNYLPVVVLFLVFVLVLRRADRRTWLVTAGTAALALVPWCIAAFVSSSTFLFPLMQGTWNHGLSLQPTAWSWVDHLTFIVACCIDTDPLVTVPILFVLLAATRDTRHGRPLTALFVACTLGFLLLAYSFGGSDSWSMWRYAFGYSMALTAVFALEIGAEREEVQLAPLGRWVMLVALLLQLAYARTGVVKRYANLVADIGEARALDRHGDPTARREAARYAAMQAAVPAGARLAAMVDDAAFLDFSRNDIALLDTPGYASPAPQLPSFCGPDAWRAYLVAQGLRYVAFVRADESRYFYRREFWIWRIFNDSELFQIMSAYTLDAIDTLAQLATPERTLYDHDGLVVLDLAAGAPPAPPTCADDEPTRRFAYFRTLTEGAGYHGAWQVGARPDVSFGDGYSNITRDVEDGGLVVRWMGRRAHARLRGNGASAMHLQLRGHMRLTALYTHPRLDVTLDGAVIATATVDDHGAFAIDTVVPAYDGWADLYVVFSTMATPEKDPRETRLARLDALEWAAH